jgi:hypothetical protein
MNLKLLILFNFIFCYNGYGILEYQPNDQLYVWAESGLNLREKPNSSSEVIAKIDFGNMIICKGKKSEDQYFNHSEIIIDQIKGSETKEFSIKMKGNWVKVSFENLEGFVFDAYLSKSKPIKLKENNEVGFLDYFNLESESLNYVEKKDSLSESGREKIAFSNGKYLMIYYDPGGIGFKLIVPDFSIEEAILLIRYLDKDYTEIAQTDKGEINIEQQMGGYQIKFYENIVIINGGWGC